MENNTALQKGPGILRTALPAGFRTSGINCGVRKYRPDLGIILSDRDCIASGVFTLNECKAAPVVYCQKLLPASNIRAIVTNSGQANAAVGPRGFDDNLLMVQAVATKLACKADQVLSASTGVIGQALAIDKIVQAVPELVDRQVDNAEAFALAILTTDLIPKSATISVRLKNGSVRITGIAKGSGMIHPNMATMLGYLLTDAVLTPDVAQSLLKAAADRSFNMISVDGDTSTNDCVFLLANGAANTACETPEDITIFQNALTEVAQALAQAIARDGEGATKLIEVQLTGSPSLELARKAARGITLSPLIKTAIHGEDPNWGRILARLGAEGVPSACLDKLQLEIQGTTVFAEGAAIPFDRAVLRNQLKMDTVTIKANLHSGSNDATAWGCDLSKKYVEINTEYS